LQVIHQPTNERNKTQFVISIENLHGSAPDCHPRAVY